MAFRWVVDARGVDRRVYNLRARWRSPEVRRGFPRPLYEAICRSAVKEGTAGADAAVEDGPALVPDRGFVDAWVPLVVVIIAALWALRMDSAESVHYVEFGILVIVLAVGVMGLLALRYPALRRPHRIQALRIGSPLEWVDDGQMAAAIVVNGRCPSCAYPVDPARREADGAVVCAECGGAWVVVRRGGELRLGR
jgi:hypothetical protein